MLIVFSGNCGRSMYHFRLPAIKYFMELGHKVKLVLPEDDYTARITSEGFDITIISSMELSGTNPLKDYKLYKEYIRIYGKINPDIIFQYTIKPNIYGTNAAKKLNIPCVAVITGLGYTFINKGLVPSLARKMYRFSLKKASQVWFLNTEDKSLFEKMRLVNPAKAIQLNGEGIDTNYFAYTPINYSKRSFILIARLLYDKGAREYYEAARQLKQKYPDVSFKILGFLNVNNPMAVSEAQLKEWTSSGVIEYLGSANDVKPFIEGSTCVVLPSYREGMSITLMEGASMGRPLVATKIPGCRELIDDGNSGYLCQVKDAVDLASKMENIINMPKEVLQKMSIQSRDKMVNEFDIKRVLPFYENALKLIIG
jgi:glycosyltransferase involved in cell wall biosynthesis